MRISDVSSDVCSSDLVPVEVALACEDRARVATTHGDDHVGAASGLIGEGLGELLGDVEAALGEDLHHSGVDLLPGRRPGRPDGDAPGAGVVEQNASGDGAPRVVRADDEYLGGVGQSGRASCRGRVCQYAWISVGAVSLK